MTRTQASTVGEDEAVQSGRLALRHILLFESFLNEVSYLPYLYTQCFSSSLTVAASFPLLMKKKCNPTTATDRLDMFFVIIIFLCLMYLNKLFEKIEYGILFFLPTLKPTKNLFCFLWCCCLKRVKRFLPVIVFVVCFTTNLVALFYHFSYGCTFLKRPKIDCMCFLL